LNKSSKRKTDYYTDILECLYSQSIRRIERYHSGRT